MLNKYQNWIFDMDGTLTVAQHDFDAIRAELGLPENQPILESIAKLDQREAEEKHKQLNQIELEIAHQSKPASGATELLIELSENGANLGVLTRNNAKNIQITLMAAGLYHFFEAKNLLSRDCVPHKPAPDGIQLLLKIWQAKPDDSVIVGDHNHDLLAGRNAGITTIYVDTKEQYPFKSNADLSINSLKRLLV